MDRVPERERVPLGRPINNVSVYVVDEYLAPVPLGAPGEIVFSGVCVGRGYINDPERTRRAFMADPHRADRRLYRSGDYGRWLPGWTWPSRATRGRVRRRSAGSRPRGPGCSASPRSRSAGGITFSTWAARRSPL